jgi:acyl dehydratase
MAKTKLLAVDDYKAKVGQEVGVSDWILVDQGRIDKFAEVTGDHQFIHVDPEKAKLTPFGGTIAHGYLTLSLLSAMAYDAMPGIEGAKMGVNYGLNKLRFMAPVRAGKRIRGRFTIADVTERSPGQFQTTVTVRAVHDSGALAPRLGQVRRRIAARPRPAVSAPPRDRHRPHCRTLRLRI